jgi:hypothetical protein
MSKSGVIGVIGQTVVCAFRCTEGEDPRRGTLSVIFLVGSSSESIAGRFCPRRVPPFAAFESVVRAVREFIADR